MDELKQIAAALGLADTATVEEILTAITDLVTVKNERDELEKEVVENRKAECKDLCNRHGITDATKQAELEKVFLANRTAALAIFGALPAAPAKSVPLTNRTPAKTPAVAAATGTADIDRQRDAAVREYALKNRCEFTVAWDSVRLERPELFADRKS